MRDEDRPAGPDGSPGDPVPAPDGTAEHPLNPAPSGPFAVADDDAASGARLPAVPPDPMAYDSERNAAARKRGLSTPYVPGGRDPDLARTEENERRLLRWLVIMVVVIVLAGFVLGMAAALLGLNGLVGIPT